MKHFEAEGVDALEEMEGRPCDRGNHEKTIAQLKSRLTFQTVPTMAHAASSAWQQLNVLAHTC